MNALHRVAGRIRRPIALVAFALPPGFGLIAAEGTTLNWNNAGGGSAATSTNWTPNQVPTASDDLVFNLAATYAVTFNATVASSRTHLYKRGTVTLSMTSPHTASTGVIIGDVSGDNATTTLTTGTFTANAGVVVGDDSGSTGTLNVNDDDADFIVANAADLTVGNNGAANLNITGSGRVEVADQFIAGSNSTSAVTIEISGFTVAPIGASTLDVVGVSQSRVGQGGDVTMIIEEGALAGFNGDLVVANGSASLSSITVQTVGLRTPGWMSMATCSSDVTPARRRPATEH